MKRKIYAFLIIVWLFIIFFFSNQSADTSTKVSKGFSRTIIVSVHKIVGVHLTEKEILDIEEKIFVPIRKGAHFFLYLVLGIFVLSFLHTYPISFQKKCMYAFIFCLLYASTDEIHQLFVPGRAGQIRDVCVDMLGSLTGFLLFFLMKRRKIKI